MGAADEGRARGDADGAPRVPGLRLLRVLGAGGQAEVWLADDLVSGDRVAVKVGRDRATALPVQRRDADGGGDAADARRLAREVALLRRIDHPHVVRLRRVVDLPGGARALVLDHAEGGSLDSVVRGRGPLTAPEACTVVVPLARTLADLHERGLVHGDLTPSNVLFTADGRPLVADLGCAAVLGTGPGERWGSDGYVDPAAGPSPAPTDDVYALGALLRFMLTGAPAGPGPSAAPVDGFGDARRDALLALADLCTADEPGRRPDPREVAQATVAATGPAPVRLAGPLPAPPAAGPDGDDADGGDPDPGDPDDGLDEGDPDDDLDRGDVGEGDSDEDEDLDEDDEPRGGVGATDRPSGEARPVVVRIDMPLRRPRTAADAGWARSAGQLPLPGGGGPPLDGQVRDGQVRPVPWDGQGSSGSPQGRPPGRANGPAGDRVGDHLGDRRRAWSSSPDDVPTAALFPPTRVDLPAEGATRPRGAATARPSGTRRPPSRAAQRSLPQRRSPVRWMTAAVVVGGAVTGWWLVRPSEPPVTTSRVGGLSSSVVGDSRSDVRSGATPGVTATPGAAVTPGVSTAPAEGVSTAAGTTAVAPARESVTMAVLRFARGRAEAFRQVSEAPLDSVDEPGSPALAADRALVARLRAAGTRLDGLTFTIGRVRTEAARAGVVTVRATVTTSAHLQVSQDGTRAATRVPASAPRAVVLTLVPAPDGRHWLVRRTVADA
jgi:hypothetical protein